MNAGRQDIRFALYSEQDFEKPGAVGRVLEHLMSAPLGLRPTHYGYNEANEPITNMDAVVEMAVGGAASHAQGQRLGGVLLRSGQSCGYQVQWAKMDAPSFSLFFGSLERKAPPSLEPRIAALYDLLKSIASIVQAVYGEVRDMSTPYSGVPVNLTKRLPDIPAVSIYGLPYVSMFGEQNLRKAPFHRIEQLVGGRYWLEASESVFERVAEETKAAIRSHLGEDAFASDGKRLYRTGRAPHFDMSALRPLPRTGIVR